MRRRTGEPYTCFVRPDTRIPFMAMPDGVEALLTLAAAPRAACGATSYNVGAFSPTAEEIRDRRRGGVPGRTAHVGDGPEAPAIVDSWPADVDDGAARRDWGSPRATTSPRVQRISDPDHQTPLHQGPRTED